jgi:hypothetical protein
MIYALIKNSLVVNIISGNQDFISKISSRFDFVVRIDELETKPGIGWSYDGVNFTIPTEAPAPTPKPRDAILNRLELAKDNFETLTNNQKDVIVKDLIRVALHYIKAD